METPQTLREFVDNETDEKRKVLLTSEISHAERIAGRNFDGVKIRSVAEMGEAAGRCHMCSGEIEIRKDIVETESGIRGMLAHALVHEGEHAGEGLEKQNHMEGFTELATTIATGQPSVPAYRERVEHARHIAQVIGEKKALELARSPQAKINLCRAYIRVYLEKNGVAANLDQEVREAKEHILKAA